MKKVMIIAAMAAMCFGLSVSCKKDSTTTPATTTPVIAASDTTKKDTVKTVVPTKTDLLCGKWWKVQSIVLEKPVVNSKGVTITDLMSVMTGCQTDDLERFNKDFTTDNDAKTVCSNEPVSTRGKWNWNSTETMITDYSSNGTYINLTIGSITATKMIAKGIVSSYYCTITYIVVE